jgi:hypothetical protein
VSDDPDIAFVLEAFQAFEVREGTLEEYHERFWVPDGVVELGHDRALAAARDGGYRT